MEVYNLAGRMLMERLDIPTYSRELSNAAYEHPGLKKEVELIGVRMRHEVGQLFDTWLNAVLNPAED